MFCGGRESRALRCGAELAGADRGCEAGHRQLGGQPFRLEELVPRCAACLRRGHV